MPPPFTFAPRATVSSAPPADVHSTGGTHTEVVQEADEDMGEQDEDDMEEDEEEEGEEEGEDEGPVDMIAIEVEELRRDVAGLEEPTNPSVED